MIRLKSLSVTDFRSIRGTVDIPLDAPVVLIHGKNGAGKTSLLSAIEFGLTGRIQSLAAVDPDYMRHLIHKDAVASQVIIEADGLPGYSRTEFGVTRKGSVGKPLLQDDQARFFSERCFLAQSTLSRLLEMYGDSNTNQSHSPLTRFVKDLLGLDHLDSLIDGLVDAGHRTRLKSAVPRYAEVQDEISRIEGQILGREVNLKSFTDAESEITARIAKRLHSVGLITDPGDTRTIFELLRSVGSPVEHELRVLSEARADMESASKQWASLDFGNRDTERADVEQQVAAAESELQKWRSSVGADLVRALSAATKFIRDLPSTDSVGPAAAHSTAKRLVRAELERCSAVITRATEDDENAELLNYDIQSARERMAALDQRIAEHVLDAGSQAKMLSDVLPHVHTDECPVCQRNFREISAKPLEVFLSERISSLSLSASRLQDISRERASSSAMLATAERALSELSSGRLDIPARIELQSRLSALTELWNKLGELESGVGDGQALSDGASRAIRRLSELKSHDLRAANVREAVSLLSESLSLGELSPTESVESMLSRIETIIESRTQHLLDQQAARREASTDARERLEIQSRIHSTTTELTALRGRIEQCRARKAAADDLIDDARSFANRVQSARSAIVRRVFNEELNAIWRQLFVRLSPDEPFVPRFALSNNKSGIDEAAFQTIYKAGGDGGNPRMMLSAGNLNTAALTLFLALHLSAKPSIPWLVIDDPVQSMDEIHIAQLAALLRTLAKTNGKERQLIIAVHEKPLFDYLSLEMSPAFPGDKLITVELSHNAGGETVKVSTIHTFVEDKSIEKSIAA